MAIIYAVAVSHTPRHQAALAWGSPIMGPQQLTDAAEENCNRFRHHTASMIDFDYDLMGLSRHNNVALLDSSLLLEPFSD